MDLTEEQKNLFLDRYLKKREYSKEYYKKYQKQHKDEVKTNNKRYLDKIKQNDEKMEQLKLKRKEYYNSRGKELAKFRSDFGKNKEPKILVCECGCKIIGTAYRLNNHRKTDKHIQKMNETLAESVV